jgi:vacuolar protein sorting-associated protein 72
MRASTLKTEADILAKEADEKTNPNRKGRRAQHETGEVRVVRKMTQDELIAAALEEEERNKEELRKWLRREEERRELRRVGRKRVRGPRWTWISRTVGKLVEVVEDKAVDAPMPLADGPREEKSAAPIEPSETPAESAKPVDQVAGTLLGAPTEAPQPTDARLNTPSDPAAPSNPNQSAAEALSASPATAPVATPRPVSPIATPAPALPVEQDTSSGQYTRNYLILSQIPGGLPAELKVVLGDHVEWDEVQYIPSRNRPINRRPPVCPFTGLPAKYRHPETLIPYAAPQGYREIEALLANRYVWNEEGGCWMGGEEDAVADGVEEVPGWREAMMGGWLAGKEIVEEPITEDVQMEEPEQEETPSKGKKRKPLQEQAATKVSNKSKKGKAVTAVVVDGVAGESDLGDMKDASGTPKKKSKRKR